MVIFIIWFLILSLDLELPWFLLLNGRMNSAHANMSQLEVILVNDIYGSTATVFDCITDESLYLLTVLCYCHRLPLMQLWCCIRIHLYKLIYRYIKWLIHEDIALFLVYEMHSIHVVGLVLCSSTVSLLSAYLPITCEFVPGNWLKANKTALMRLHVSERILEMVQMIDMQMDRLQGKEIVVLSKQIRCTSNPLVHRCRKKVVHVLNTSAAVFFRMLRFLHARSLVLGGILYGLLGLLCWGHVGSTVASPNTCKDSSEQTDRYLDN